MRGRGCRSSFQSSDILGACACLRLGHRRRGRRISGGKGRSGPLRIFLQMDKLAKDEEWLCGWYWMSHSYTVAGGNSGVGVGECCWNRWQMSTEDYGVWCLRGRGSLLSITRGEEPPQRLHESQEDSTGLQSILSSLKFRPEMIEKHNQLSLLKRVTRWIFLHQIKWHLVHWSHIFFTVHFVAAFYTCSVSILYLWIRSSFALWKAE